MNEEQWLAEVRGLHDRQARGGAQTPDTLRVCLAELDAAMRAAPWAVRARYTQLCEADLTECAGAQAGRIEDGSTAWPHYPLGAQKALTALAVQIRAVDDVLGDTDPRHTRIPANPGRDWRVGDSFVIPSRRRRDLGSRAGNGLGYDRRGTLKHRVLPTVVDGLPVRLINMMDLDPARTSGKLRLGAAVFPGLVLEPLKVDGGFQAKAVEYARLEEAIERQLDGAASVHAIVWPELTADDDTVDAIAAGLARRALATDRMPNAVVAGSWHRPRGDAIRNTAPVLDGYGDAKGSYSKMVPFLSEKFGWEVIEQGDEILVLVCDRFLASVAICKDYCDLGVVPPWHLLDVDLMLVPSMGNETTMEGHVARAKENRIQHDQLAFVVQQGLVAKEGDALGYVLPAPRNPPADAAKLRMEEEWQTYQI
jgi:predicted amidohydrolase